jgi:hypothetical protein
MIEFIQEVITVAVGVGVYYWFKEWRDKRRYR